MRILFGLYYTMADRCSAGIYEGIRQAGHEVTVFPRLAIQDEVRETDEDPTRHVYETLRRRVMVNQPDVVLGWSLPTFFPDIAAIEQFRVDFPGVKLVELSAYHPYALWEGISGQIAAVEKGARFDMLLCQCHESAKYMDDYGSGAAVYFPSFATPRICDIPESADYPRLTSDVLLPWATMYDPRSHPTHIDRTALALALLDAGITNLRLYGGHHEAEHNGWMRADPDLAHYVRPEASVHETVKAARMSNIVINTSAITPNSVISPSGYWSDRVPMTMLAGTLCLTDNPESLAVPWEVNGERRQIVDGEHLVTYDDIDDCVEKCKVLLEDHERRETVASAGREFARKHLTEGEVVPKIILPAIEALLTDA